MEIELLRKHGMSLRKIAEEVGCAVNTVRSHLAADGLPKYARKKIRATKLSPFGDYLRERQTAARPAWIPATVLMREIVALGYTGSHSQLRAHMQSLKPTLPVDPVATRPSPGKGLDSGPADGRDPAHHRVEPLRHGRDVGRRRVLAWHMGRRAERYSPHRPDSGKVLARLTMPEGVGVSGLESDGADLFYAGGGASGKVRAVRRPKRMR